MKNNNLKINQQEELFEKVKSNNYRYWLGGFIEGEGSLVISISINKKLTHGIALQPEFNVTQHESGKQILNSFKYLFNGAGSVHKKSGSVKVWVYSLKGTTNLMNYVIPFYRKYVLHYSSKYNTGLFETWYYVLDILYNNSHHTMEKSKLIELVTLIYSMNPEGKGKQRKRTLDEIIDIISKKTNFVK